MAGATSVAIAAQSTLDSNKPVQDRRSNTEIMAATVGGGLAMGVGTELFFNQGSKLIDNNRKFFDKYYPGKNAEAKKKAMDGWAETFRTTAFGTNDEIANNTARGFENTAKKIDGMLKKANIKADTSNNGAYKFLSNGTDKLLRSKVGQNSIGVGMSTTKGRIFNYGFGTAMSAITGGIAIHRNNQNNSVQGEVLGGKYNGNGSK